MSQEIGKNMKTGKGEGDTGTCMLPVIHWEFENAP